MGTNLIIGNVIGAHIGSNVNQDWYGVERDNTITSPDWTRIASSPAAMTLHATMPIQALFKPCVINADKTVNYYLDPTDLSKKLDGTSANLTGADGNVMSYQSKSYWKHTEKVGTVERMKFSPYKQTDAGWVEITPQFYSVYEGRVISGKLSSVSGVLPTTYTTLINFRIAARANGAGFEQQWIKPYTELVHLFQLQFATNNFQKPVNLTLTVDGYCQGGLGNGITTAVSSEWAGFNSNNPFVAAGGCNSLLNHWGEASVIIQNFGGAGVNRTFTTNRFLFVENIFGHIWKWIDGVTINHLADRREAYVFDNPAHFVDGSSLNGRLAGLLPITNGYVKELNFPEILPKLVGGNSGTQYCDYFYSPSLNSGWRALISGGSANRGEDAGAFFAYTYHAASTADAPIGARLHVK
jgi:hypothetical protein